jgi:hypothetical protein
MKTILVILFALITWTTANGQDELSWDHPHCGPRLKYLLVGPNVWAVTDKMPQFPGGPKAVNDFIVSRVQASQAEIQAHPLIAVGFVIDSTGQVVNVCIQKSKSEPTPDPLTALEQEVLRVTQLLPNWSPGEQKGRKVAVGYAIPVRFKN